MNQKSSQVISITRVMSRRRSGMGTLDGQVAVVTGAGRGLGREHALLLAEQGVAVVVNDLGGAQDGTGAQAAPAQAVAEQIRAAGGQAVANGDDVADAAGAQRITETGTGGMWPPRR